MSLWSRLERNGCSLKRLLALGAVVGLLSPAAPVSAQVVRGLVTERTSNSPLGGVVIAVLDARDSVVAQALTDDGGKFDIRLRAAGAYALDVKRIGVKRVRLPALTVASGETQRVDVAVEPLPAVLRSVKIIGKTSCVRNPQTNARIAALWEDARAALTASLITRASMPGPDSVERFERKLNAKTWQVLYESRRMLSATMDHPFRSLPAEVLSIGGYVTVNQDGSTDYYAPDAEVLLSDAFLADHCFKLTSNGIEHRREIGLAFEPVPEHRKPDIKGVLWLDASTSELRTVDFAYTWLPNDVPTGDYGGTVSFFRLPGGRWIVLNWRLRMPEFGRQANDGSQIAFARTTGIVARVVEEGGTVPLAALASQSGRVRGVLVRDTVSNRPMFGITVALAGTDYSTLTAFNGSFDLPFVPPGSYSVVLRHPTLDSLGIQQFGPTVDVGVGQTAEVKLRFPSNDELAARMCDEPIEMTRQSIVRFIVVDGTTGNAMSQQRVVLARAPVERAGKPIVENVSWFNITLDDDGGFLACGVGADELLRVEALPSADVPWVETVRPQPGTISWHVVKVRTKR